MNREQITEDELWDAVDDGFISTDPNRSEITRSIIRFLATKGIEVIEDDS